MGLIIHRKIVYMLISVEQHLLRSWGVLHLHAQGLLAAVSMCCPSVPRSELVVPSAGCCGAIAHQQQFLRRQGCRGSGRWLATGARGWRQGACVYFLSKVIDKWTESVFYVGILCRGASWESHSRAALVEALESTGAIFQSLMLCTSTLQLGGSRL
jgi:hypothetical protein